MIDYEVAEFMFDKNEFESFKQTLDKMKMKLGEKKLVIFGAGIRGGVFGKWLAQEGAEEYLYADNNQVKWGGVVAGHPILTLTELEEKVDEVVVLISVESKYQIDSIGRQLTQMGFVENDTFFYVESDVYDRYIEEFKRPIKNHVLVMGDCRFTFVSVTDAVNKTLDDILREKFSEIGMEAKVLSMHALGMRAQYNLLRAQLHLGNRPKQLVLPINYETFNGSNHLLSSSQHNELMQRIYNLLEVEDSEFKEYVEITAERESKPQVLFSTEAQSSFQNLVLEDTKLKLFLRLNYMYDFKLDNEGVIYLFKILKLAEKEQIKVHLFVPPLNYMSGKELLGNDFIDKYEKGLNFLIDILYKRGYTVLNQSYLLSEDGFYNKYDKNEIANYEGKIMMANSIIKKIFRGGGRGNYIKSEENTYKIDHLGIAVKDITKAYKDFCDLGFRLADGIVYEETERNVKVCFIENEQYNIELISPLDIEKKSPVDRYIAKTNVYTPYHICFKSIDIQKDIENLVSKGYLLIHLPEYSSAMGGRRTAYLYHERMQLLELVEEK